MATPQKDTIYIDVDDEITTIVDKVQNSTAKVVALVLPKRAAALQSIVNMKLLKSSAEDSGKTVVLITSEAGLLPLAGAVGVYAAKNLQSKPEVPDAPEIAADEEQVAELSDESVDANKSVGELAGATAVEDEVEIADSAKQAGKKSAKKKGDKKPKVPNFEKFRLKLILGIVGVIALIGLWYFAVFVSPSATVVVNANSESVNTEIEFTATPSATSASVEDGIIPAEIAETEKEESQTAPATGEKDLGAKATGTVTMAIACADVDGAPPTIPAGTGVSSQGLTFITQSNTSLTTPSFNNGCQFTGSTKVTAQNQGEQYNIAAATYSVSGYSNVTGSGSAMSGGSSKIAKVVSEQDVDTAKGKLSISDDAVKSELSNELSQGGYYVVDSSFEKTNENTAVNPKVGAEASEVTVTYSADFELLGVNEQDLDALLKQSIADEVDVEAQGIQDNGLGQANFTVKERKSDGSVVIALSTVVTVGPDINQEELKNEIAGDKRGDAENTVKAAEGVQDVTINLSPFWVSRVPKNPDKITFEIQQPE